ncbi:MAG: methylated-DNA--[protein]-cysteine S-methyltransferase [Planctomycetales bacterium]
MPQFAAFPTDLGWFGLVGEDGEVLRLVIGHLGPEDVRRAVREAAPAADFVEEDWDPDLRRRLEGYARGEAARFADCRVRYPLAPAFRRRVYETAMRIPYGSTLSYAELAAQAGSPQAARAVGNAMASNRVPILIPCHRVIGARGRLGGFSAPQGTSLKQRMLALEAASLLDV